MYTYNDMDAVFQALAHETRRTILDIVKAKPGCNVGELAREFDVSRIAIMNHLTVLEKAGLILSEKQGRSRCLYINLAPLQMIYDRWTDKYSAFWNSQMKDIKYAAEKKHAKNHAQNQKGETP